MVGEWKIQMFQYYESQLKPHRPLFKAEEYHNIENPLTPY